MFQMIWGKSNRISNYPAKEKAAPKNLGAFAYVWLSKDLTAFRPGSFPVYFASSHGRVKHIVPQIP